MVLERLLENRLFASDVGVGAVLSQRADEDDRLHPCTFLSRRLSAAEKNYDVGGCELLAVKLALEEWRQWLEVLQWGRSSHMACHPSSARPPNPNPAPAFIGTMSVLVTHRPGLCDEITHLGR